MDAPGLCVLFLIDNSGSMADSDQELHDAIQKKIRQCCGMIRTGFHVDLYFQTFSSGIPARTIRESDLCDIEYSGDTKLFDALISAMSSLGKEDTIFLIFTDGYDTDSEKTFIELVEVITEKLKTGTFWVEFPLTSLEMIAKVNNQCETEIRVNRQHLSNSIKHWLSLIDYNEYCIAEN